VPVAAWLVRHARAEQEAPGGDAARRLTAGGRAEFQEKLRRLGGRLRPTRILTSPFARARETAGLLAAAVTAAGGRIEVVEEPRLASGASTGAELLALAREAGRGAALVGHNPELAEAIALAGEGRDDGVPPGTVAALDRGGRITWVE
jgi:phosphohistidine phosphatase